MLDYIWRDIRDVSLKENVFGATISFCTVGNSKKIVLDYVPKDKAREIYRIAQEKEEATTEERRLRRMEEDRAKAGGVQIMQQIGTPSSSPISNDDPAQKIQKLKQLLESGFITQDEYDYKRKEIINLL